MSKGSSLSVEKPDIVLISSNGVFSAGFYSVGFNAYCFAIWYREPLYDGSHTIVWMANRDQPINGRLSKLTLHKNGNLILTDAGQLNVWVTNTESIFSVQLLLNDTAADFGIGIQRRLTMDHDGNIRMYSLDEKNKIWNVTWQAKPQPCTIHGICGPNSLCTYVPHEKSGRRCSCIPGYKIKNETDQSLGCEPDFSLSCNESEIGFLHLPHVEFYGYDNNKVCENYTYKRCANECLQSCNCYAFQYKFNLDKGLHTSDNSGEMEQRGLVKWVREKKNENVLKELWLEEIIDPMMKDRYDASKMEILVEVALQCADEDKDARPTMSQVVERLLHHEAGNY
ncbi:putative receptor protein kinase ZmPK1 [Camellia lanceoleosa]|uniref:Receptor protein kinase ZmPK1 n=1 Tax=Camellia lanceoleosa TaxID=1840588 RepID=A0ACC0FAP3_9ERIC|nr:putative receptor protein kinase ZmPK1 [Camellia lanceoleosa]